MRVCFPSIGPAIVTPTNPYHALRHGGKHHGIDGILTTRRADRVTVALLVALTVAAWPTAARAQGHPCDAPAPGATTIAAALPHKLQFCALASEAIEALIVVLDGTPIDLVPITAKTQPSALGLTLYETTPFLQVARGAHVITAAAYNRNALTGQLQVGAASPPFSFGAVDDTPIPTAPSIRGVAR